MQCFFELMERDPDVAAYLVNHIVSLSRTMTIDPSRPLELPFWLAALPSPVPLWPKISVIGADRGRAKALWQTNIEGRWTGDEQTRTYVGYAAGKPCIEVTRDREQDVLKFTFL